MAWIVLAAIAVGCTVCLVIARAQLRASLAWNAHHLRYAHEHPALLTPMVMRRG